MTAVPPELIAQVEQGDVLLFIGPRLVQDKDGRFLIDHVVQTLAAHSGELTPETSNFAIAAQAHQDANGRADLVRFLRKQLAFQANSVPEVYHLLAGLTTCAVQVTTGVDRQLETAFVMRKQPLHINVTNQDLPSDTAVPFVQLTYLHGVLDEESTLILTEDDVEAFFENPEAISTNLKSHLARKSILFIGFDLADAHFVRLYRKVTINLDRGSRQDYALAEAITLQIARWCTRFGVTAIESSPIAFLHALTTEVSDFADAAERTDRPNERTLSHLQHPYKRLGYYDTKDAHIFFGREREIQRLSSLIHAHRLVLLYGSSGIGKTSLLLAGVIPHLQQSWPSYESFYVRTLEDPLMAIFHAVRRRLAAITAPDDNQDDNDQIEEFIANLDLPTLRVKMIDAFNEGELKDLCFDMKIQFGGLSGDSPQEKVRELLEHCRRHGLLLDLVEVCRKLRPRRDWPTVPTFSGAERMAILDSPDTTDKIWLMKLLETAVSTLNSPLVIFLDQFEALFTRLDSQVREAFISQLGSLHDANDIPVKFVLSLRDEWLAAVSELETRIPEIFSTRMHLVALRREQAFVAITGPIKQIGMDYDLDLVDMLLDDLVSSEISTVVLDQRVMPPHLQLVCDTLYERVRGLKKMQIETADYQALGRVTGILGRYLEDELSRFLPQERAVVQIILEELITAEGARKITAETELIRVLESDAETVRPILEKLVQARLLRLIELDHMSAIGYELVHDYLVAQIGLSPAVRTRKAVEEMMERELRNWDNFGTLISLDRLHIIAEWRGQLHLSAEAQTLIEKSLEEQDLDTKDQLQIIQSDKITFLNYLVAGIDKEISSPIASIMSNSRFMHQSMQDIKTTLEQLPQYASLIDVLDDLDEIATELNQAAVQMDGLAKALSNFAQPDVENNKVVEMLPKLETALLLLEHPIIKHSIEVTRHIAHRSIPVLAPASHLVQLFMNILMGSIVAINTRGTNDDHGKIIINVYINDASGVVGITHNGSSIPYQNFADQVSRRRELLRRLQRAILDDDLLQAAAISGKSTFYDQLGLTIANEIVRRHKGSLEVSMATANSVTLTIKIPLDSQFEGVND